MAKFARSVQKNFTCTGCCKNCAECYKKFENCAVAKIVPEVAKNAAKIVAFCKNRIFYINKVEISVWVSFCLIYVRLQLMNPLDG